jgi:hypothetical protein
MASKQSSENTEKSPTRTDLADSSKKFGKLTLKIRKEVDGAESGEPVEAHEFEDQGEVVVRHVKKDGKVLQSAATQDAQESGEYEKAAKKTGDKKPVFTTPIMNAVQDYVESHDDETPKLEGEDAKLTGKTKEKKPKSKPSTGKKPDNSMSKEAKQKTGQADKPGDRDIRKDMEKDRSLEKTDKIEDLSVKRAAIKARLEADAKDAGKGTKLTNLIATVKKLTSGPRQNYNPADASDLARKLRDQHNARQASALQDPKLDKAADQSESAGDLDSPYYYSGMPTGELAALDKIAEKEERKAEAKHIALNAPNKLGKADPSKFAEETHKQGLEPTEGLTTTPQKFEQDWDKGLKTTKNYHLLSAGESNTKLRHGMEVPGNTYHAAILHFAPADLAGVGNMCPNAGFCKGPCLVTSGQGGTWKGRFNDATAMRLARTKLFSQHPNQFWDLLLKDIKSHINKSKDLGATPAIRLNGTSDIDWASIRPKQLGGMNVFEAFPHVQFWDYTKRFGMLNRHHQTQPQNYHLTFSADSLHNKANAAQVNKALEMGYNVATPFGGIPTKISPGSKTGKGGRPAGKLPESYSFDGQRSWPVIDGDETDFRFLDAAKHGEGSKVVGLRAKGDGKHDYTGFTRWNHSLMSHPQAAHEIDKFVAKNGFHPTDMEASKQAMKKYFGDMSYKTHQIRELMHEPETKEMIGQKMSKLIKLATAAKRKV